MKVHKRETLEQIAKISQRLIPIFLVVVGIFVLFIGISMVANGDIATKVGASYDVNADRIDQAETEDTIELSELPPVEQDLIIKEIKGETARHIFPTDQPPVIAEPQPVNVNGVLYEVYADSFDGFFAEYEYNFSKLLTLIAMILASLSLFTISRSLNRKEKFNLRSYIRTKNNINDYL